MVLRVMADVPAAHRTIFYRARRQISPRWYTGQTISLSVTGAVVRRTLARRFLPPAVEYDQTAWNYGYHHWASGCKG